MRSTRRSAHAGLPERTRRRLRRELGPGAKGKFVAVDRRTGGYVVARDLDALVSLLTGDGPKPKRGDWYVLRVGHRAAIELRGQR